jgi:DNA-binding winged helix-turn-helix (wHTH) protein/tetratricopeptide (TPR) repeat protein
VVTCRSRSTARRDGKLRVQGWAELATAQSQPNPFNVRFSVFEVDVSRGELLKSGTRVKIQKQPFQILCMLLERPAQVVSREELRERLWPDNTFVEYEDSLNTAVRKLRGALCDSSAAPLYIETVARQGYRFIAPVAPETRHDSKASEAATRNFLSSPIGPHPMRTKTRVSFALALVVAASAAAWTWGGWWHSAAEASMSPRNRADEPYQKGRLFWNMRSPAGFAEALRYFHQAVTLDPHYAPAYAGIADTYALMSGYDQVPADEYMPKARAAALKAIELNNKLAEAHASLAVIAQNYDWDWQTAQEEYRRAIALDPNYATAHHWYAECLALQGRFPEALTEIERARQLDGASLIVAADRGAILYFARQYGPAIEQFRAVRKLDPFFSRTLMVSWSYIQEGRLRDAREELDNWQRIDPGPWRWAVAAHVAARAGDMDEAQRDIHKVEEFSRTPQSDPMPLLSAYVAVGDKEKAFEYLDLALRQHSSTLISLKVDPTYDPLRNDSRFPSYLKRLGLTP